jgi:hypothetical protein
MRCPLGTPEEDHVPREKSKRAVAVVAHVGRFATE